MKSAYNVLVNELIAFRHKFTQLVDHRTDVATRKFNDPLVTFLFRSRLVPGRLSIIYVDRKVQNERQKQIGQYDYKQECKKTVVKVYTQAAHRNSIDRYVERVCGDRDYRRDEKV